ncbi:MAG: hypothetical protein HWD59_13180 [Coxiellaceae bacterium]|nr:MAG: hypothetical protein HWD59_13180 [Coxiellaceae bacterium]
MADTEQQYYNNTLEIGPGIVFVPTNRYNIAFRYEKSAGYYLPVNSPSVNPYGSHYHNTVVMLEIYMRF